MAFYTVGKGKVHFGYTIPLYCNPDELFADNQENINQFQMIIIEKGNGILSVKDKEIPFIAPTVFCLNQEDVPKLKNHADIKAKSIYFHPNVINMCFNFDNIQSESGFSTTELQDRYMFLPFVERNSKFIGQINNIGAYVIQQLIKLFGALENQLEEQKKERWPCRSRSILIEMLILIIKVFENNEDDFDDEVYNIPENISEIISYLQTHYQEKIVINDLVEKFNINRTSLSEQFYKATNSTIIEYLINIRINLAATCLRDTRLTIAEIREKVGINDSAQFWRMFKKHTGLSPSEYRNKYCWMKE